ncbi:MAG: tRNA pseudouridine(38-40) synthase TruA [Polyangiales bacterium]
MGLTQSEDAPLPHGVLLVVAYDGTEFHGYQEQPNARTVQGTLAAALAKLEGRHGRLRGSSRTDSGVHAMAHPVAFGTDRLMPPRGWLMQLNTLLPDDLAVRAVEPCPPGYDPRFDAVTKLYRYRVHVGYGRDPLRDRISWFLSPSRARKDVEERSRDVATWLDVEAMRDAARRLEGTRDFAAFKAADDPRTNTVRTLRRVSIEPGFGGETDSLAIEVRGDAFMKNMVRILAGTLVDVGRGRFAPAHVDHLLSGKASRAECGPTAPAQGLVLVEVELGRNGAGDRAETGPTI